MMKNKIDYKKLRAFLLTPRGKAVAFFGFYFIFFLLLAVFSRMHASTVSDPDDDSTRYQFSISDIEKGNYHFKYSVAIGNDHFVYEGDKKDNKELFVFNGQQYYRNLDTFLKNTNGIWLKTENPYVARGFIDINSISKILDRSSYLSKTDYESGMKTYNYSISTTTLVQLIDQKDIDLDDFSNAVFIKTDENDSVDEIIFSLDNYCKYKNIASNCNVDLEYSNFSKVDDIEDR